MSRSALAGLGQALRWLRSRQTKKQYQVADDAGITKGMLSSYETGRQRPSLETLEKLLDTLGCNLSDLHQAIRIVNGELGGAGEARWQQAPSVDSGHFYPPLSPLSTLRPGTDPYTGPDAVRPSLPSFNRLLARPGADLNQHAGIIGAARVESRGEPAAPADNLPNEVREEPGPNLYQILGLDPRHRLPPEEEEAMALTLQGFHGLLRYLSCSLPGRGPAGADPSDSEPEGERGPGRPSGAR